MNIEWTTTSFSATHLEIGGGVSRSGSLAESLMVKSYLEMSSDRIEDWPRHGTGLDKGAACD